MFDLIRADLERAKQHSVAIGYEGPKAWLRVLAHLGVQAVVIYRFGHWAYQVRIPVVRHVLIFLYWILRAYQIVVCQVSISAGAEIGPGFVVHNWGGVFVPPVKAGRNLYLSTGCVIGYAVQSIGDDVTFAVGAKAHGPIRIGSNVSLGANTAVSFNVPDNRYVLSAVPRVVPRAFFNKQNGEKNGDLLEEQRPVDEYTSEAT